MLSKEKKKKKKHTQQPSVFLLSEDNRLSFPLSVCFSMMIGVSQVKRIKSSYISTMLTQKIMRGTHLFVVKGR